MKPRSCAGSWAAVRPLLPLERPTLAQALEVSSWTTFSAQEVRTTSASALAPTGQTTTVATMRTLVSSAQVASPPWQVLSDLSAGDILVMGGEQMGCAQSRAREARDCGPTDECPSSRLTEIPGSLILFCSHTQEVHKIGRQVLFSQPLPKSKHAFVLACVT